MNKTMNKINLNQVALILFSFIALFSAVNAISYSGESCGCAEHKSFTEYNGKGFIEVSDNDKLISFLNKGKNHFSHNRKESDYKQVLQIKIECDVFIFSLVCCSKLENSCESYTRSTPLNYLTSQMLC